MSETTIVNARIDGTRLSMGDHGALTYDLFLSLSNGGCCSYGGYCIGHGYLGADDDFFEAESGLGLVAIMKIMNVVGVEKWEDLKGKYIRVESTGWGGTIDKIGNIMENKWFSQKELFGA